MSDKLPHSKPRLLAGTTIVATLTILSRIFGFVRDLFVARLFGAGMFADAFFVAFRIPNLLRSFVAEGALTSAFVPIFSSALADGSDKAKKTLQSITAFLLFVTILISILGVCFSPQIISAFAPGYASNPEKFDLTVLLARIMMPYIICVSLIAMLNAALNAVSIFGTAAWAQVIMNLVLIVGAAIAFLLSSYNAVLVLAVSVLIGGIVQVIAQIPATRRAGFSLVPSRRIFSPEAGELLHLMLPAVVGASIYQCSIFIDTILASLLPEGSVSWLFYADRVAQLPMGIFSIALASVLLPALARAHVTADKSEFNKNLSDSLRFTSFIIMPMSALIIALSLPIVTLLFERGLFSHNSSIMTSRALCALASSLWATSCHSMLVRAFIARKDTVTPTLIGAASLCINVLSSIALMGPPSTQEGTLASFVSEIHNVLNLLPFSIPALGHAGLAAGSSVAAFTSLLLAVLILNKRLEHFAWRPFVDSSLKTFVASLSACLPAAYVASLFPSAFLSVLLGGLSGVVTFILIGSVLKIRELKETFILLGRISNRAKNSQTTVGR